MLAHALLFVPACVNSDRRLGVIPGNPWVIALASIILFGLYASPLNATAVFVLFVPMFSWCAYAPFIGKIAAFAYRKGASTVRLSD